MDDSMHMMSECSQPGMDEMHDHMSAMVSEMVEHWSTLKATSDLPSARTACASHVTAMRERFESVHEALDRTHCRMMGD
jgi:hypothetical protein